MNQNTMLLRSCQQVFERLAYMICDIPRDSNFSGFGDYLSGSITYEGPSSGCLCMYGPGEVFALAGKMALGDDSPQLSASDALHELLNVICGVYVYQLDPMARYAIGLPQSVSLSEEAWRRCLHDEASLVLLVENMPVVVQAGEQ
jgi:hypothetical protein